MTPRLISLLLFLCSCDRPEDPEWDPDATSGFAADPWCCPPHGVEGECTELLCVNERIICPDHMGPRGDITWCTDPEETSEG